MLIEILLYNFDFSESLAAFVCLMFCHFEWPALRRSTF